MVDPGAGLRTGLATALGCGYPPIWLGNRRRVLAVLAAIGRALLCIRGHTVGGHLLLHRLHSDRGRARRRHSAGRALAKTAFYAVIAVLAVAPLTLGDQGWYAPLLASGRWCFLVRSPTDAS